MFSTRSEPSQDKLTNLAYGRPAKAQNSALQELTRPHIESYDYVLREGLSKAVQDITPVEMELPNGQKISLTIRDASISSPTVAAGPSNVHTLKIFPSECRERGVTYKGSLQAIISWQINGQPQTSLEKTLGEVPIMVKSSACNLSRLSPSQLIEHKEEGEEMGGYFICNGIEKVIRMLIMPRRNYPTCINRPSWKNRGPEYTEFGVSMRCVKPDQTSTNMVLHYLNSGSANLCFTYKKEQFYVPVVLVMKALVDVSDKILYTELMKGKEDDSFYRGCVANMLRQVQNENLFDQKTILKYIGERFQVKVNLPSWYSSTQIANFLIQQCVCIHLSSHWDKFILLAYMTRKVFTFAKGGCCAESADNPMNQEVLLGGHLFLMVLKEKIENWLLSLRASIDRIAKKKGAGYRFTEAEISNATRHAGEVTKPMEYLMATGNLVSKTGLGLMQASGLTVVADKLNFIRYISHFRCIHRGAFFSQMRTTSVRKLQPEAWGFLCPVHTPDGAPCGLMNHMSSTCHVVNLQVVTAHLPKLLCSLGMMLYDSVNVMGSVKDYYDVMLDGKLIGLLHKDLVVEVTDRLRLMKVNNLNKVPNSLEICVVPMKAVASQYPGVFLFTSVARMMRPVYNLIAKKLEMLGTFEQVYLNIGIVPEEFVEGVTTHQEIEEDIMLSTVASLTPYSDHNQSPRNMYQCQMAKQTMGVPCHATKHRSDNKLYKLQTPQSPLVRTKYYDKYDVDSYPIGTNAVVAVISYTGYDMEDAMILNKSSFERGFAWAHLQKHEFIDLANVSRERNRISLMFCAKPGDKRTDGKLDPDGLPYIGTYLTQGSTYYSYINVQTGEVKVEKYRSQEPAYIDHIKILGNDTGSSVLTKICICLRVTRNPIIGDKFASRAGQKGICSQKWPAENMPFTESGMVPDIIFNPHGYPSRMTIGMMIETMAGKSASLHGLCHDATPFTFSEDKPAIDHFGKMLTKAGYNYYGTETMYSGVDGREFEAKIFIGLVYYQRLRHMVSDKFQVRTTGPVDIVTQQPIKGRKRGGGIRFGEMERDAVLAHGAAFILHDRLVNNSDKSTAYVCTECGSLLSPILEKPASADEAVSYEAIRKWHCKICRQSKTVKPISVPYVFRYLINELAAMNIKLTVDVK